MINLGVEIVKRVMLESGVSIRWVGVFFFVVVGEE